MSRGRLLTAVDGLRVWQRGSQRAPHKPLLVLLMLARLRRDERRLAAFPEIEDHLRRLLHEFGPPRHSVHPEYPFWHLRSDGIWDVPGAEGVRLKKSGSSPPVRVVRELAGGFTAEAERILREEPDLQRDVAQRLLDAHFPASLHEDILTRVGLDDLLDAGLRRQQRRDPAFRRTVLRTFDYRCAVCGYDGRQDTVPVGLDAAHLRWWAAGGPDDLSNALALCVLHHKALDLGVLGLTEDQRVKVSQGFHGGATAHAVMVAHGGRSLLRPQTGLPRLAERHRRWHDREVFRHPPRLVGVAAAEEQAGYEPDPGHNQ